MKTAQHQEMSSFWLFRTKHPHLPLLLASLTIQEFALLCPYGNVSTQHHSWSTHPARTGATGHHYECHLLLMTLACFWSTLNLASFSFKVYLIHKENKISSTNGFFPSEKGEQQSHCSLFYHEMYWHTHTRMPHSLQDAHAWSAELMYLGLKQRKETFCLQLL